MMTTDTSQIDKVYRNEKAPKVVIQTKDGNKYSCYDRDWELGISVIIF